MNQKQLKKILSSINNKINNKINEVKSSISEVSITDKDFMATLDENDYLIPINVKIIGYNDEISFKKLTIKNGDNEIIYSVSGTVKSFIIYLSKQAMDNPIVIDLFDCSVDYVTGIIMNDVDFEGESGHEDIYTVNKVYNLSRTNCEQCTININNLTGDIIIGTYPLPPG